MNQRQTDERIGNMDMALAESIFPDRQRALMKRFGQTIETTEIIDVGEIVEAVGNLGMLGTKDLFRNRKCAGVERLGPVVRSLLLVEDSEITQRGCDVDVFYAQRPFTNG